VRGSEEPDKKSETNEGNKNKREFQIENGEKRGDERSGTCKKKGEKKERR